MALGFAVPTLMPQLREVSPLALARAPAALPEFQPVRRRVLVVAQQRVRSPPLSGLFGGDKTGKRVQIQAPGPNRRVVSSEAVIFAPIDVVWDVLSDYESLADYIPNLAMSDRRPHPAGPSAIRLEQCGVQSILGFEFRASVTMDMVEINASCERSRAIDFTLVHSRDFREFFGTWRIEALPEEKCALYYTVTIVPKGLVPVKAIEWRIGEDVPQNIDAVKRECELRRRTAAKSARRAAMRAKQME
jgi:Polyketide cyclase / dehydrase and lipid transport